MKKGLSIVIIFFLIFLLFQVIVNFFITKHHVTYSVNDNKYAYDIEENFSINNKIHTYNIVITDSKKNKYTFNYNVDLNKQRNIIKSIKTYTNNKLSCIVPIFKRDDFGNIYCNLNDEVFSYTYISSNNDFKEIFEQIKKDGYFKDNYNSSNNGEKLDKTTYYKENIPNNYKFILWDYFGIDLFTTKGAEDVKLMLNEDSYDNRYSRVVGKYYVALNKKKVNEVHYYNLKDGGEKYIPVDFNLTGNYLILGINDNKLYLVDLDSNSEYSIDPYKSKIEEVGNETNGYVVFKDGAQEKIETVLFKSKMKEYVFENDITNDEISKKYGDSKIYMSNNTYYFKTKDNIFYKANINYPDKATKLFKSGKISTWKVVDDTIIFVSGNSLFFYDDNYGVKKILSNNELKYNYNNICDLYMLK